MIPIPSDVQESKSCSSKMEKRWTRQKSSHKGNERDILAHIIFCITLHDLLVPVRVISRAVVNHLHR